MYVTAAGNDELAAITAGAPGDFDRFAGSGCFRENRRMPRASRIRRA